MTKTRSLNLQTENPANDGGLGRVFFDRVKPPVRTRRKLTARQQEILQLLAKGFYYKEIGDALGISPFTVRAHLHTVYRKLEVKSRARAVLKFQELAGQF
jgi:DNA-binding NarL/FixJ family response regulator